MKISREHLIYTMSKNNPPAATCQPGEKVTFETCDCFSDAVKLESDLVSSIDFSKVNPATGPLYVEGAEVGDVLKVDILAIDVDAQAVSVAVPGLGVLGDTLEKEVTKVLKVTGDQLQFNDQISLPLRKMIGVIGTAPADKDWPTGTPDVHGGNMDCLAVAEGNSLYLPVNTPGALLALGDLHATMGEGEVCGAGAEIRGEVTVKVDVLKNFPHQLPMIESPTHFMTLASHENMFTASQMAVAHMAAFLEKEQSFGYEEALIFLSLAGDLKVCQAVDPQITMRMEVAKSLLA